MTKRYRSIYWALNICHLLLNIGPMAAYCLMAYIESNLIVEKITLSMTVLLVTMFTLLSLINKAAFRCRMWILLIGLYICLDYIMTPLIIFAVCQTLDELMFYPLTKRCRTKLTISKEMDKRYERL